MLSKEEYKNLKHELKQIYWFKEDITFVPGVAAALEYISENYVQDEKDADS